MTCMAPYMEPDEYGPATVRNVYFDTSSHLLVRRSQEKPLYKEKIRVRSYGCPKIEDPLFLELKKKFKGIVYKRRSELSREACLAMLRCEGKPHTQIEREIDFAIRRYGGLEPAMFIAYDREAFYARRDHGFRITFDRNIRSRWQDVHINGSDAGTQLLDMGMNLMEVKCGGALPLWLVHFLTAERLYKCSFSKYGNAWVQQQREEGIMPGWVGREHPSSSMPQRLWHAPLARTTLRPATLPLLRASHLEASIQH